MDVGLSYESREEPRIGEKLILKNGKVVIEVISHVKERKIVIA